MLAAEKRVKAFGSAVTSIGKQVFAAGAAVTAPFLAAAKSFADIGSELNDMSARTGISVEALSALGHAAGQTGADLETVEKGVRKMQQTLVKGSQENLQAEATFLALGLSVQELAKLAPEQQFEEIAKAIGRVKDPTARAAAALQVFGKAGTALLPMIADFDALTDEAKKFGLVWTGEEAENADALGDAIDLLTASLGRVVTVVGSALAPMLTELAGTMARLTKTVIDWAQANGPLIATVFKVGAGIAAFGAALVATGVAIQAVGAGLGVIATVLAAVTSPITLVIAGLAGLAAAFVALTEAGTRSAEWLGARFVELEGMARAAFKGIADALKAGDIALAGQILWAGLKVEWLKGINYLNGLWADWGTATIEVFQSVSYRLAGILTKAWAGIQVGFVHAVDFMLDSFDLFVASIKNSFSTVRGFFEQVWAKIQAIFTGNDAEAEIKKITDEVAAAQEKTNQGALASIGARDQSRTGRLDQIEQSRQGALSALGDQQDAEIDARRKAAADGLAAGAADLKAAQDELARLMGQAGKGAGAVAGAVPKVKGVEDFTPEAIDEAVGASKKRITANGAFAAAAFRNLGVGDSLADEQVKESKKQTDQLEKLNRKAAQGRLIFQA